jgi:hypothetical protein
LASGDARRLKFTSFISQNCSALIWALFVPVTAMLGEGNAAANVTAATVRNEGDAAIFVRDHKVGYS